MSASHLKSVVELDPRDVQALLEAGRIVLVDVREPAEYAAERIHGALLYPLSTFDATTLPADDVRELVFHCGSGKRSLDAARRRLAAGALVARHMTGGIAAWRSAGLPTIRIDPATGRVIDISRE
jgi:rhodanese-related sulfurtransferase